MRIYHSKPAKNGANQSSHLQHPPALPKPSTSHPFGVTSATSSQETMVLAANTHARWTSTPRGVNGLLCPPQT